MKAILLKVIPILAIVVLSAKILSWFLNFSAATKHIINAMMFSVIGVSYVLLGFQLKNVIHKMSVLFCGIFLIVNNFLAQNTYLTVLGIVAVLYPMLLAKFSKELAKSIP